MEIQKMLCHKAVGRGQGSESHEIQGHAIYNGTPCSASMSIIPGRKNLKVIDLSDASLVAQKIKNLPAVQKEPSSFPGLGRSPGEGNGSPLQYSCLRNPTDKGACRAKVHGVTKSQVQLRDIHFLSYKVHRFIIPQKRWGKRFPSFHKVVEILPSQSSLLLSLPPHVHPPPLTAVLSKLSVCSQVPKIIVVVSLSCFPFGIIFKALRKVCRKNTFLISYFPMVKVSIWGRRRWIFGTFFKLPCLL